MDNITLRNKLTALVAEIDSLTEWTPAASQRLINAFNKWLPLLALSTKFSATFNPYLISELETDIQRAIDMTGKKEAASGRNSFSKGVRHLKSHIEEQIAFIDSEDSADDDTTEKNN